MAATIDQCPRLKAVDFVISCSICQSPWSRIYTNDDDNRGLHQNKGSGSATITKMWLTECAHITCGKHLRGGGAPFHAEDQIPRSPCPLCTAEKGDDSEKALYAINSFLEGQSETRVPKQYFQVPPTELGAPGNEAIRVRHFGPGG